MSRLLLTWLMIVFLLGCSTGVVQDPVPTAAAVADTPTPEIAATPTPPPATSTPAATAVADTPTPDPTSTLTPLPGTSTPTSLPANAAISGSTPTPTIDPTVLLPDLQTLPPYDLMIQFWPEGNRVLRFSNSILNGGPGVLKVLGDSDPGTATTRVTQHVYNVDGTYEEHAAGAFEFHPTHDHWHVENFALYEVWSLTEAGELDEVVATTDKVSYCLLDETRSDRPDAYPQPTYTLCDQVIQGISPGWIDTYEHNTPGQIVDITGLPNGVYALRSTVDPANQFREVNAGNNAGTAYFELLGDEVQMLESAPTSAQE